MVCCELGAVSSFSGLHIMASVSDIATHAISELFSYTFKTHDPLCAFPVTLSVWVIDSHLSNKPVLWHQCGKFLQMLKLAILPSFFSLVVLFRQISGWMVARLSLNNFNELYARSQGERGVYLINLLNRFFFFCNYIFFLLISLVKRSDLPKFTQ